MATISISNEDTKLFNLCKASLCFKKSSLQKRLLKVAAGKKFKKLELELLLYEGEYRVEFKNTNICILLERDRIFSLENAGKV